ncbi:MAG TPA: ATP-binding cassette domain-containing protein [Actinospica sp.]|nr:ATP-binding cassette domain-containing protein [Actinospica sp.]
MSVEPAVLAERLVKTYPGPVRALDGVSLAVGFGQVLALLGTNGAGKSTVVKILTTLARPDSGTARVAGHDVVCHPERVRAAIGVVAQRSGADPHGTGRENLVLQGRLHGMRGAVLRRRVDELLERFDLGRFAGRLVHTYSGGTQRRLDVALGLVHAPRVLFLDEPTTGLDPRARAAMWDEVARLADRDRLAVVLTTHHLEEADRLAGRLAVLDGGRIVAEGTPDELKGALRGDALHVDVDRADGSDAREALRALPSLRRLALSADGVRLSARTDDGAAALPDVLAALARAGVAVTAAGLTRPTLDDVYLAATAGACAERAEAVR